MKRLLMLVAGLALLMPCAYANDSTARVGAGGLELLKTDNIQMVSEVLEISTSKIKVTYHFLNTSDKDIKTTVAFPMPAFTSDVDEPGLGDNQKPLDSFQTTVNGQEVVILKNRVFLARDIDVTKQLREAGLPDSEIFNPVFACTSQLFPMPGDNDIEFDNPAIKKCKLTKEQFILLNNLRFHKPWKIKETAYWEQIFPAGKEMVVVHEYLPFVGRYQIYYKNSLDLIASGKEVCASEIFGKTGKSLNKDIGNVQDGLAYVGSLLQVEYILGTGRNWKGPIKNFKLIIKKSTPSEIISLCFPSNPLKTSPTKIEFSTSNYIPQEKLIINFYSLTARVND